MTMRAAIPLAPFLLAAAIAGPAIAAPGKCDLTSVRAMAPAPAVIRTVTPKAAPVPHCEVLGHITTTNPGPNRVEFSVLLPDEHFGGRFYFVGEGAGAGF